MNEANGPAGGEPRPNPYVGPRSLRPDESLYGRDRELDQLRDALVADRILLLYSPSGAGKSSLLEAGLRPALTARGFFVAPTIRVNQDAPGNRYAVSAMLSIEEATAEQSRQPPEALGAMTLASYVASVHLTDRHGDADLCLFFDQFEEVFALDPIDVTDKAEFFEQLGELLRDRNIWALISMREDFIAQLDPYLSVFPRRLATRIRLDFLDDLAATAAVRNPALTLGVQFTDEAVAQLVGDLRTVKVTRGQNVTLEQGPYVEPVQLQVVCRQLWARLPVGTSTVTAADVDRYANTDDALGQFYAEQVSSTAGGTGVSERSIRDWFEHRLITPQGFRSQTFDFPGDQSVVVLKALEDAYLIRADTRRGTKWYELTHDRMITPIIESNATWREGQLNPVQRRAAEWDGQRRPNGLLITGDVLAAAEQWAAGNHDLVDTERDFLTASRHAQDQATAELEQRATEARQARRRSVIFAGLALVAVTGMIAAAILFVIANRSRSDAQGAKRAADASAAEARDSAEQATLSERRLLEERQLADARDLAGRSETAKNSDEALLLAIEAENWTLAPLPQARLAWEDATVPLARQPARLQGNIPTDDPITSVAWKPDGTMIATGESDPSFQGGSLRVFDATTRQPIGDPIPTGGPITSVAWRPDGTMIATGGSNPSARGGSLRVFDATTRQPIGDPIPTGGPITSVAWKPDGTMIATGGTTPRSKAVR